MIETGRARTSRSLRATLRAVGLCRPGHPRYSRSQRTRRTRPPRAETPSAPDAGEVIVSHGISAFGDLKYPKDFAHFDYVNPDAPQGGTMSFRGTGGSQTFDSLNPFILKGEPAQGLGLLYDSLLAGSADEPDAAYGLVAESLEYPPDRSWADLQHAPRGDLFRRRADHRRRRRLHLAGSDGEGRALLPDHAPGHRDGRGPRPAPGQVHLQGRCRQARPAVARRRALDPAEALLRHRRLRRLDAGAAGRLGCLTSLPTCSRASRSSIARIPTTGASDLPVNVGTNNFDCYVYQYFADNTAAFEALKVGDYLFHEEYFSASGRPPTTSRRSRRGG